MQAVDRRLFLTTSAFLLASLGCRPESTVDPIQSQNPFSGSKKTLTTAGYQIDQVSSIDRQSENLLFVIGDFHDGYYRKESIKLIEFLIKNSNIDRIGIEGLYGEPRASIVEDRYLLISKLIGQEAADRVREQDREYFDPILNLIKNQSITKGKEYRVFGLEEETQSTNIEYISRQLEMFSAVMAALGNKIRTDSNLQRQPLTKIIEQMPGVKKIISELEDMTTRVNNSNELASKMNSNTPHFSRDLLLDTQKLTAYMKALKSQKLEHAVKIRNEKFTKQIAANQGKAGIIAYAGWLHVDYLSQKAELSTVVVDPIRDPQKNQTYKQDIDVARRAYEKLSSAGN